MDEGNGKGKWKLEPARDLGLSHKERLRSLWREKSIFSASLGALWWAGVWTIMRLWLRFEVVGRENLPKDLPFVLIGNHSSHLDVVSLILAVPMKFRDRVFPLAAADHFFEDVKMATFTTLAINALPLDRKNKGAGKDAMEELRQRLLSRDCGLALFPEGTRSRTGEMSRFRLGIGMLVAGTDIPVVPCYIEGAHAAFPAERKFPKFGKVRLHVGKPVLFADAPLEKEGYVEVAQTLESRVRDLGGLPPQEFH